MRFGRQGECGILWLSLGLLFGAPIFGGQAKDSSTTTGSQGDAVTRVTDKTQASATAAQDTNKKSENKEISMQEVGTTFNIRVNLVQLRVIVRDQHDKTVDNLKREDFQVYDQGKLQAISSFGVETASSRRAKAKVTANPEEEIGKEGGEGKLTLPERFVAMVFDDTHMTGNDEGPSRAAALKFLSETSPKDRVGIYSTSGLVRQEFSSDEEALKKAVMGITPRTGIKAGMADCPDVTYYMADLIQNKQDSQALQVVSKDTEQCLHRGGAEAQAVAQSAIHRKLQEGNAENEMVYRNLEEVLRRLSAMPGERVMLMVSPGFQVASLYSNALGIVDRANQANIVINTLDSRGLYGPQTGTDVSRATGNSIVEMGYDTTYRVAALTQAANVLRDFAYGTGGTYFGNSNDILGGMKLLGAAPDTSYVLSFSPQSQKMDGRYHTIKVTLTNQQNYTIQARNGYYAAKKGSAEETANEEIEEAALAQDEIENVPLEVHTQYFKGEQTATVSVVSHVGVNGIHFRKNEGRHEDNLTLATVIFDQNGEYVTGGEKIVTLKLQEPTYEKMSRLGLTFKSNFELKPGRYLVRQVVRESEGGQMGARNCAVEIP